MFQKLPLYGMRDAIIYKGKAYSYITLINQINRYSTLIEKMVINKGEVVVLLSDYSFNSIALFFCLYKNKNIIVPITTQLSSEVEDRVTVCRPEWIWNLHTGAIEKRP